MANRITEDRALYSDGAASDKRISDLINNPDNKTAGLNNAMDILLAQNEQLARQVAAGGGADKASAQAKQTLADASKSIGVLGSQELINFSLPPNTALTAAIQSMSSYIGQLAQDKKGSDDALAAERKSKTDLVASDKLAMDEKDKQIADANAKAATAQAQIAAYQAQTQQGMDAVTLTATQKLKESQDANTQLANQLQVANKKASAADTAADQPEERSCTRTVSTRMKRLFSRLMERSCELPTPTPSTSALGRGSQSRRA